MKFVLTILSVLISFSAFGQDITWEEWQKEATTDIRLFPRYGDAEKNSKQKKADKTFVKTALEQHSTKRAASEEYVQHGFNYLYSDIRRAMYRFNQAYLLDPSNSDIYWGFGAVYMILGQEKKGLEQYEEGLKIDPENPRILTDYGTYYLGQYYVLNPIMPDKAKENLEIALDYLSKSYEIDQSDQNTTFKLSVLYLIKEDCYHASKYYEECLALGGQPISKAFTSELLAKCNRDKR